MEHVSTQFPKANIYLVGFSLGASTCFKYMNHFEHQRIKGIVSVSNPFDVFEAAKELNSKKNYIYGNFMTNNLIKKKILFNIDMVR